MATGTLTALQLDAASGLLQNQGIGINANLTLAIDNYESTALIAPFLSAITTGSGNILSGNVILDLETLAANTCAALSNSVPPPYGNLGTQMTTVVLDQAAVDICNNNVSQLSQAVNQAQNYASQTSVFINSAVNSQTYLGIHSTVDVGKGICQTSVFINSAVNSQTYLADTFTNINSMITGGVTNINLATPAFGQDLVNLGQLINLKNLNNFGSPAALVQQLYNLTGTIPVLSVAFVTAGVPQEVVLNLNNPTYSFTDSAQRLMYEAMTQITGPDLAQILSVFGVTTTGIETMADLLNPVKLFPLSYQSLTAPTKYGPVAIYVNDTGSVNQQLATGLPPYVLSSLV